MSAEPCGCDKPLWVCEQHRPKQNIVRETYTHANINIALPLQHPANEDGPHRVTLPTDKAKRKQYPIATGVLDYFPDAIAAVAHVSWHGNNQHNPGEPLHWSRHKSTDQADTMLRHFLQRGSLDDDGIRHSAKMVWRALAILQLEIEAEGK